MPGYHVTIYIDEDLLRRIEETRGDVPRSRFIVKLIKIGMSVLEEDEVELQRRQSRLTVYRRNVL
ncbi:MAG: hypothetical protein NZ988_06220 [Thaumarchaeota archaeon]|nr:hypothetical protein [Candidatus Calditenuaceae archaeon]MDW8187618.1 hypothetical protein [Nitrososphaerota archaeon]